SIQNDRGFPYGIKFFDPEHGQIKMIYYTANPYSDRLAVLTTVDGGQEWRETESTPIWEEWDGVSAVQMRIHLTDEEEVRDRFWELAGWSVLEEGCYEECESAGWDGSRWRLSREGVESYIVSMCLAAEGNWIEVTRIPRNYRYFKGKVLLVEE
ncbi:MAG: hypothetical protein N0A15_16740, partial [Anaerolineae bacterium]|nr:hypothetical protein [Anaerolineae bacterium]